MKDRKISIVSIASISGLGHNSKEIWNAYKDDEHRIFDRQIDSFLSPVCTLTKQAYLKVDQLRQSNIKYKQLDDTVLMAIVVSREAISKANWGMNDEFGINIGSSRGATKLFEKFHKTYLSESKTETLASPTSTLGNISSWVAHDLKSKGPEISHSITCSTALHGLLNGVAWINSGMANKFLVGGSESPLTGFTLAQMKALKVYASSSDKYPCQALNIDKGSNTMVVGEGAAVTCLEAGEVEHAIAIIEGIGYATELLEHNASLSTDAKCIQDSMQMAMKGIDPSEVDVIVTHSPGTIKGDMAELNAIDKVFKNQKPSITCNKWKVGHTFATSGMLSLEMAILMLQKQIFIDVPYIKTVQPEKIKKVLVNAVGFGGNAVSVLLTL